MNEPDTEQARTAPPKSQNNKTVIVVAAIAVALLISLVAAFALMHTKAEPPRLMIYKDIPYVPGSFDPFQRLDLYLPSNANGLLPLIVFIHGGGWAVGDKLECPGPLVAQHGFAAASINYRLTNEAIWPAQIYDCKAAIRWLRANASQYHVDPNRIGVWGASSGGHLVSLLGTTGSTKELEGDEGNPAVSSEVQAVCDWNGPTDFFTIVKEGGTENILHLGDRGSYIGRLFGALPEERPEMAKQASPLTYIASAKKIPPFLIMHGDKDNMVPIQQSEHLYKQLQDHGVKCEFIVVKGAGHQLFATDSLERSLQFFQEQFCNKQPATDPK